MPCQEMNEFRFNSVKFRRCLRLENFFFFFFFSPDKKSTYHKDGKSIKTTLGPTMVSV